MKRNNKLFQASELPIIANMNPRSVYNKVDEFCAFIKEESVDLLAMSESWEREGEQLDQVIQLDDFTIISNVHQRRGVGGRPALFVNNKKYHVKDITNTLVNVKWGVEAVWCIITPKNISKESKIQRIA